MPTVLSSDLFSCSFAGNSLSKKTGNLGVWVCSTFFLLAPLGEGAMFLLYGLASRAWVT